jgi:hypothetical protein
MSPDVTRYAVWVGVVAIGALFAILDWRWIGRPLFGALLAAGVAGGIVITKVSPFDFSSGGYFMEGVLLSAGSALALVGYVIAAVWQFARQWLRRHGGQ